jgi:glycosyltransferase involved in cell wall biosynthesis
VEVERYLPQTNVAADAPLVFLGRLERIKGVHHAIAIARAAGRRLVIAGNRVEQDGGYFDSEIAPRLDGLRTHWIGPCDDKQKNELLGAAAALLMPVEWDEPFGLVMIEALACGTPVIGFPRGGVTEIVRDGKNGFLCRDVKEAVLAVGRLGSLDRREARRDCEMRFAAERFVEDYERLYFEAVEALR